MDPVVILVSALLTGWLFLSAGWHKLRNPYYYGGVFGGYISLPEILGRPMALLLGTAELAIGVGVLVPGSRVVAGLGAALLLVVYMTAMGANLLRGRGALDCGCSGPLHRQRLSGWLLVRNGLLAAVAWSCTLTSTGRPLAWPDWFLVVAAGLVAVLFYLTADRLLSNRQLLSGFDAASRGK